MASGYVLNFVVTLILARLLAPADFGLVAIANVVITALKTYGNMGLSQSLIFRKGNTPASSSTGFYLILASKVLLFAVVFVFAPWMANFFDDQRIVPILRVLDVIILVSAFSEVPTALLTKELLFKKRFIAEILALACYATLAISMAAFGWGVWSLVIADTVQEIVYVPLIWWASGWRPTLKFDWSIAKEILNYGKDIVSASILSYAFLNIDNTFVGKLLGAEALGLYAFAFALGTLPVTFVTRLTNQVTFPVYVKLNEQTERISKGYLRAMDIVTLFALPANLGLLATAPLLIPILYSEKWIGCVVPLQILTFYGIARAIGNIPTAILRAIGKQDVIPKLLLAYFITTLVLLWPVTHFGGVIGVSVVMSIIIGGGTIIWVLVANRYLGITFGQFVKSVYPQTIASVAMLIGVLIFLSLVGKSVFDLVASVAFGIVTYAILILWLGKGHIILMAKEILQSLRN
jgi:O-antigen/teichoic acid export membrane protein